METPKQLNFEQLGEKRPEDSGDLRPLTKEEFSELLKFKDYKNFVEKFKESEGEAKERGVNLTEALKYLETGEGNLSAVRNALLELCKKEMGIDIEKVEEKKLFGSDKELGEFLAKKTKWGEFLRDFDFFIGLPKLPEKGDGKTKTEIREEPEPINKKEYLDFAKKLKSVEKEIRETGLDFDRVVKLSMGGKDDFLSSVEAILELIIMSEMEKFRQAAERRGNPYSDEELIEIGCKMISYKLLVELKTLRKLEKRKRELTKEEANEIIKGITEMIAGRMGVVGERGKEKKGGLTDIDSFELSRETREMRVKKAREEFQKSMWATLLIVADLYKSLSKESAAGEETSKNLESFKFYKQILEAQAVDMANWSQIKPEDIFIWKSNSEKYLTKKYIEDGPGGEEFPLGEPESFAPEEEGEELKEFFSEPGLRHREEKIKEAKEQFQNEMRDFLEKRNILWSEISKLGASEQDEEQKDKKIQEITKINEQLIARATELTEEENYKNYTITWKEVFDPEEPPDLPGLEKNVGGPEQEIPPARRAFLELRDSLKEIILEKTRIFDEVARLSEEVSSRMDLLFKMENLSPAQKKEYEEKIQTNYKKIKEAEIKIKEINDKIEKERERIAKKYGIDKNEIEFDFHLGEFGREPYSSV